jgi:branched-chain amino acid transport system ATP-binding protein
MTTPVADAPVDQELPELRVASLTVGYGAFVALRDITATFPRGEIVGLIGPNGAGKTTLLNAVSGFSSGVSGEVRLGDQDITQLPIRDRVGIGVVRGFQTVRLLDDEDVLTNVALGTERLPQPTVVEQWLALPRQRKAARRDQEATWRVLDLLGLSDDAHRPVDELPFASRRLVEVGRVLVTRPSVILLDEPAAGLDTVGRIALEEVLRTVHRTAPSTLVIVEHDVALVARLCSSAIALDSGQLVCTGTPQEVLADERVQRAYFGRTSSA